MISGAAAMGLGTLVSRLLGLGRDILLAALFSRTITDAFFVAFRLPNLFRRLLGEGVMTASFVPLFIDAQHKNNTASAALAGPVLSLLWLVVGLLTALAMVYMELFIELLVPGSAYMGIEGKFELTVYYARIVFAYLFLVSTYAFLMSVLNAYKKFFLPALAPAFYNLTFIAFILMPDTYFKVSGAGLVWGVVAGGVVQVAVVAWPLYKQGVLQNILAALVWPHRILKSPGLNKFFKTLLPAFIGLSIVQLMGLANTYYASFLAPGSHSYIYWADRILELPQSLIATSFGVALLPTLSSYLSQGQKQLALKTGQEYLRIVLYFILPSSVGLYLLAHPIVAVLFQHGRFGELDTLFTAELVRLYAFLLIATSMYKVISAHFFALKNTWLPACTTLLSFLVHIILARFLLGYGLKGLMGSMTLCAFLNLMLLSLAHYKMIGPLGLRPLARCVGQQLPALLMLAGFVVAWHNVFELQGANLPTFGSIYMDQARQPVILSLLNLLACILGAMAVYFATNELFRHPLCGTVHGQLKKRLLK